MNGARALLIGALLLSCRRQTDDDRLRASADQTLERARVPALGWAVVSRDRESAGGAGLSSIESGTRATAETPFEAASIAKLVIATCVMQLVEQERLTLDGPLDVGFPLPRPGITLRRLLTHRAGIRDVEAELLVRRDEAPLSDFLHAYLERPSSVHEDRETHYSNVGAALAALVVERAAGQSFGAYAEHHVFAPLGMTHTSWTGPAATPYALREGRFVALTPPSHAVYPVVDLRSSATDLAHFARAFLRGGELDGKRILSVESVRVLFAPGEDPDQALGWQLRVVAAHRVAGHEGEDEGASTGLYLDLAAHTGAVVVANGDAFASGDAARAHAIESLFGDLLAAAPH